MVSGPKGTEVSRGRVTTPYRQLRRYAEGQTATALASRMPYAGRLTALIASSAATYAPSSRAWFDELCTA